jgi:MYXO-CTERM domain-containing protein
MPVVRKQQVAVFLALALALAASFPRAGLAQDGGAALPFPAAEIAALEAQLARDAATLATGGCTVACMALASMERTVARICALDPGQRCTDARARLQDATRRVQEACGDCTGAGNDAPPAVRAHEPEKKPAPPTAEPPAPAPPPPEVNAAAPKRGGCAGCVVGGDGTGGAGALAAAVAVAVLARRRVRRS